eukprot:TRINITY_DN11613_c0_g1_i1.p1 TRINITY_DN11613_c0_g1~~TRINITY_DN11613_c0_g1_i1.p1  ORF type:complete len:226 (+),score=59.64 TRINITY_DN11613_c0_g1_i1:44-679(+)
MVRNLVPQKTVSTDWRDERVIVAEEEFDSVVSKAMHLVTALQGTDETAITSKKQQAIDGVDHLLNYDLQRSKLVEKRLEETDAALEAKSIELAEALSTAKVSLDECKEQIKTQFEEGKNNKVPDMIKKLGERARLEDWVKRIEKAIVERDTAKAAAASAKQQSEEIRLSIHHFIHKLQHLVQATENLSSLKSKRKREGETSSKKVAKESKE